MKRHALRAMLGLAVALAIAVPVFALAVGDVETVAELSPGEHPEGITFDRDGNLYFGNRTLGSRDGLPVFLNALHKVTPGGKESVIAEFAPSPLPTNGLLGLVTDGDGNVYAAVDGGDDHGVWKVSGNGKHQDRIDGSDEIHFPNALTFDANGNLYVTDSGPVVAPEGGGIWRLAKHGSTIEPWLEDEALAPAPIDPFGFPAPGANGIAFDPPDSLYVANTEKGLLLRVAILADGSAGEPEVVTQAVPAVDGIAVDVHGNVHCVLAGSLVLGTPPLVEVNTITGAVTRTTSSEFDELFDLGLSLAFDTLPGERTSLYVTAGDLDTVNPLIPPVGEGPRLLRAEVGVKGLRGK